MLGSDHDCIDHPATIDLSQLATVLGAPASALYNVPLPGHDHLPPPATAISLSGGTSSSSRLHLPRDSRWSRPPRTMPLSRRWRTSPEAASVWMVSAKSRPTPTSGSRPCRARVHPLLDRQRPRASHTCRQAQSSVLLHLMTGPATTRPTPQEMSQLSVLRRVTATSPVKLNKPIVGMAVDRQPAATGWSLQIGGVFAFNARSMGRWAASR